MTHIDVSVVIPTRNRSTLLAMALRSVFHQQDVELEVIVVDEASTDDTSTMLATIGDARVRVIRNDAPHGVSAARNSGAAEARGEWLAFLDDDDLWAPTKLARQIHAAEDSRTAVDLHGLGQHHRAIAVSCMAARHWHPTKS